MTKLFVGFALKLGLEYRKPSLELVTAFVEHLARTQRTAASVLSTVSTLRTSLRRHGISAQHFSAISVENLLRLCLSSPGCNYSALYNIISPIKSRPSFLRLLRSVRPPHAGGCSAGFDFCSDIPEVVENSPTNYSGPLDFSAMHPWFCVMSSCST